MNKAIFNAPSQTDSSCTSLSKGRNMANRKEVPLSIYPSSSYFQPKFKIGLRWPPEGAEETWSYMIFLMETCRSPMPHL
jgi:hypothetical protein